MKLPILERAYVSPSWVVRRARKSYTCQHCLGRIPYHAEYAAHDRLGARVCLDCFDQHSTQPAKMTVGRLGYGPI
jgi:hypothetical protein